MLLKKTNRITSVTFNRKAVLKYSVDLYTLLIGAEGAKTPVGVWFRGDPSGASAKEARRNTHEPLVPGAEINRHV
jgi:hypothetical protein